MVNGPPPPSHNSVAPLPPGLFFPPPPAPHAHITTASWPCRRLTTCFPPGHLITCNPAARAVFGKTIWLQSDIFGMSERERRGLNFTGAAPVPVYHNGSFRIEHTERRTAYEDMMYALKVVGLPLPQSFDPCGCMRRLLLRALGAFAIGQSKTHRN